MCICFLLMTAVWIQLGTVQVRQSHGTDAAAPAKDQVELSVRFVGASKVSLSFQSKGRKIKEISYQDAQPEGLVQKMRAGLPGEFAKLGLNAKGKVASALLTPSTELGYGNLVSVMDLLRQQGIFNLGVVPIGGRS
jgi:biopolymer transport protein ExbD